MDWFLDSEVEEDDEWIETQKWVADWITDVYSKMFKTSSNERHRVWSKYFTIVEIFGFAQIPTLKLLDTPAITYL